MIMKSINKITQGLVFIPLSELLIMGEGLALPAHYQDYQWNFQKEIAGKVSSDSLDPLEKYWMGLNGVQVQAKKGLPRGRLGGGSR